MNRLLTAAAVVAVVMILEYLLPWVKAVVGRWQARRAQKALDEYEAESQEAENKSKSATPGVEKETQPRESAPEITSNVQTLVPDASPVADSTDGSLPQATIPPDAKENAILRNLESFDQAEQLWNAARQMQHGYIPDMAHDGEYILLLLNAAQLGHTKAMIKLGDYAARRMTLVEAYYWFLLAELHGDRSVANNLRKLKLSWLGYGCPEEYENITEYFSEEKTAFTLAVLRLRCAIDAPFARAQLREMARGGCKEARLYLHLK